MKRLLCVLGTIFAVTVPSQVSAQSATEKLLKDIYKIDKDIQDLYTKITPGVPVVYENQKEISKQLEIIERRLTEKPAYVEDDRVNYYQSNSNQQRASQAVAVMVRRVDLLKTISGKFSLPDRRLGLCEGERFRTEPAPGRCTAFRTGANMVATAGHCIKDQSECNGYAFVFGFRYNSFADAPHQNISADDVYYCKSITKNYRHDPSTGADWGVIELDRPIRSDIPEVELSSGGDVIIGNNVTVIGHPSGIPVKIAPNGIVTELKDLYFVATTDTFGGNSGSPAFLTENLDKGQLKAVGVLVRGEEEDYDKVAGCRKVKLCKRDECSGEDLTFSHLLISDN